MRQARLLNIWPHLIDEVVDEAVARLIVDELPRWNPALGCTDKLRFLYKRLRHRLIDVMREWRLMSRPEQGEARRNAGNITSPLTLTDLGAMLSKKKYANGVATSAPSFTEGSDYGHTLDVVRKLQDRIADPGESTPLSMVIDDIGTTRREREMLVMRADGATFAEIGGHFGVTESRVSQIFKAMKARALDMGYAA
jgi:hypothetical protein